MNSIRREHWDQARAFEDYIGKLDEDTETSALLRPWYTEWARTKGFEKTDEKTIWKLVLFNRRSNKRKKIRPYNKERLKKRRGKHTYGPYHEWVATQQCILAVFPDHECMRYADRRWVKGHHIKTVHAGGRDFANEVPVCMAAHAMAHASWMKLEEHYGINLKRLALEYALNCPQDICDTIGAKRIRWREYEDGTVEIIQDDEE